MPEEAFGHIAICNWNNRGAKVLSELRHPEGTPQSHIVIVSAKRDPTIESMKGAGFEKVRFVSMDPAIHGVLEETRVHLARAAIILADDGSLNPDAKSTMIVLALRRLSGRGTPHIIVEAADHRAMQHLKDAGADEVLCMADIGMGIIAHCALNKHLSGVYEDLLTYTLGGNELYIVEADRWPQSFVGRTFQECAMALNSIRNNGTPVILMGIRRNGDVMMNPRGPRIRRGSSEALTVRPDDALIVMAYSAPDIKGLAS